MESNAATQAGTVVKAAKPARRYDIDWLRVLAVLLLFPFHAARIFGVYPKSCTSWTCISCETLAWPEPLPPEGNADQN